MANTPQPYEITEQAAQDLEDIFDYTAEQFGADKAESYVGEFEGTFEGLAVNSKLGRERTEIRKGLRSLVKSSHVVFYRIVGKKVRIVRILHASRDLPKFL